MSFAIWYKVEIRLAAPAPPTGLGLPLTVSNDVLSGSHVLDADITVTMAEGAAADTFEVALTDLPIATSDLIRAVRATGAVNVAVHLGYFDEPATRTSAGPVLVGRVMSVRERVGEDGFARTVLSGQEEAGYLLRTTPAAIGLRPATDARAFAAALAGAAGVTVSERSTLGGDLTGFTVRAASTLDALRALADRARAPMVIRDGVVHLGDAVGGPLDVTPMTIDPGRNVVSLDRTHAEDTASPLSAPVRDTIEVTVLGHPGLRVGQVARINGMAGLPAGTMRVSHVVHAFNVENGYTTRLSLIAAAAGQRAQVARGARAVVDRVREVVHRDRDDHPAIDVGEVTEYAEGKHLAGLRSGQPEVDLHDKPIAAPFAFDRAGLMVPVYPGMRALLAHDRGLVNDAVVAGFLWPADRRRPVNKPGDYWLALPTRLDSDGLPAGPGVNDLIDARGHRVIQAAGLRVLVGADALPEVGARPDPPGDASITIEHQSGTKITIEPGGTVTITTADKPIKLSNGSVTLALDGSAVAVS